MRSNSTLGGEIMVMWRINTWTVFQDKIEEHDATFIELIKKVQPYDPDREFSFFKIRIDATRVKRGMITKEYDNFAEWETSIHEYDDDEEVKQLFNKWYTCFDQSTFQVAFWNIIPVE
jgi:hypothetical protein